MFQSPSTQTSSFSPSIPLIPSSTIRRKPRTSFVLAKDQVRDQGINALACPGRSYREAGRRRRVGLIVAPPFTPSPARGTLSPAGNILSPSRSTSKSRRAKRRPSRIPVPVGWGHAGGRKQQAVAVAAAGAGGGGGNDDDDRNNSSSNSSYRRQQRRRELFRELQRL